VSMNSVQESHVIINYRNRGTIIDRQRLVRMLMKHLGLTLGQAELKLRALEEQTNANV
jgi:hypothetical protein